MSNILLVESYALYLALCYLIGYLLGFLLFCILIYPCLLIAECFAFRQYRNRVNRGGLLPGSRISSLLTRNLPTVNFKTIKYTNLIPGDKACPICQVDYEHEESISQFGCSPA